jgi:alpha-beta hydrolase superfamily lysophospholipase
MHLASTMHNRKSAAFQLAPPLVGGRTIIDATALYHGLKQRGLPVFRKQRWIAGASAAAGMVGLAATSGVIALAAFFVSELTAPHKTFKEEDLNGILSDVWAGPEAEPEPPPALQRPLLFHATDGVKLRGDFWAQPHPAPTIILCHGYRTARAQLRPVAAIEYNHGCNVLFFDFRGHGESEGKLTSGGIAEVRDLEAAIVLAAAQPETLPGRIIIHGFSMGAAIALLTLPHPAVAAVIADSPYARLDDMLRRLVHWRLANESSRWNPVLRQLRGAFPGVAWATVATSSLLFRLRFRHALLARPDMGLRRWLARDRAADHAQATPILLIHAVGDQLIPVAHARRIAEIAQCQQIPIETYFPDEHIHCGAYGYDPAAYIRILQAFVARHVGITFTREQHAA